MGFDVTSIDTEEAQRSLPSIVNGDGTPTIPYLDGLRAASRPLVQAIIDGLADEFALTSGLSFKDARAARDKCRRPATLNKYPWFRLSHLRDYLRFRTHLHRASDFEDVLRHFSRLQDEGRVSIVKVDFAKLTKPGVFGWRMIAVDMRIARTGMLVEHYMTFRDMIEVNEAWLHEVYETWRSRSTDDMTVDDLRAFDRDARFSRHAYRELLFDGILREQSRDSPASSRRRAASQAVLDTLTTELNLT